MAAFVFYGARVPAHQIALSGLCIGLLISMHQDKLAAQSPPTATRLSHDAPGGDGGAKATLLLRSTKQQPERLGCAEATADLRCSQGVRPGAQRIAGCTAAPCLRAAPSAALHTGKTLG